MQTDIDVAACGLAPLLTPRGHLIAARDTAAQPSPAGLDKRLAGAFTQGAGPGLLLLGAEQVGSVLPPASGWRRDFSARYVTSTCATPEGGDIAAAAPDAETLHALIADAPPMLGVEYLSAPVLAALWAEIDAALKRELGVQGRFLALALAAMRWLGLSFNAAADKKRSANLLEVIGRVHDALQEAEAVARVQDLRFALDRLLDSEFAPSIDSARIVAAGHSYGANTVLLAAGAQVERDGHAVDLADARIKAAIVISAPPFYGESEPHRILAGVTVPSLHITATGDVIYLPGFLSGADDRVAVFEATGSARKLLAVFEGGSHSMFTDRTTTGGAELNPKVKAATKDLSAAFLKSVFEGDDSELRTWPDRFAVLVARYIGADR